MMSITIFSIAEKAGKLNFSLLLFAVYSQIFYCSVL